MYILVHAIKNLIRNKGRTILTLALLMLILILSMMSMLLQNYAMQKGDYYTSTYGSKVTIHASQKDEIDNLTWLSFRKSSRLYRSELMGSVPVTPKGYHLVMNQDQIEGKAKWIAFDHPELQEAFLSGEKKIVEGRMISKGKEVLISKRFAQRNELKVNDQLILENNDQSEHVILTIVGVYNNLSIQADQSFYKELYHNVWNEFYTNWETLQTSPMFREASCIGAYYLKDPKQLMELREELIKKGMPSSYILTQDIDTYEEKMKPVWRLQTISYNMMIGVIAFGGILLILVSIMAIRERTYEIGVLRSMGMRKIQVVRSFLYESFICTAIALTLSLCISSLGAPLIIDLFMQEEELLQTVIQASFTADMAIHSCLISLGLALLSSMSALFISMRYEPRRILSNS